MTEDRKYYDDDLPMCRNCLFLECDPKYCYRVSMMIGMDARKKLMQEPKWDVAGALFSGFEGSV